MFFPTGVLNQIVKNPAIRISCFLNSGTSSGNTKTSSWNCYVSVFPSRQSINVDYLRALTLKGTEMISQTWKKQKQQQQQKQWICQSFLLLLLTLTWDTARYVVSTKSLRGLIYPPFRRQLRPLTPVDTLTSMTGWFVDKCKKRAFLNRENEALTRPQK